MEQSSEKLNYWLVGLVILLLGITGNQMLYAHLLDAYYWSTFFAFLGVISSLGLYYHYILKRIHPRFYLCLSLLLVSIGLYIHFYPINAPYYLLFMLLFWSIGGLHFIQKIVCDAAKRSHFINGFCLYLSFPLFIALSQYLIVSNNESYPLVQDQLLMAVDGTLGFYPSLVLGRFIHALPLNVQRAIDLVYLMLPLPALFIYIKLEQANHKLPNAFFMELFFIGLVGYMLYKVIPACGTYYFINQTWSFRLPETFIQEKPKEIFCPTYYPRNCMPSLHTAWTITLLRYAWLLDPLTKALLSVFAFITLLAVFGIGGHYLIDIVVGLAFVNCIGGVASIQLPPTHATRLASIILGGLLCLLWYLLILKGFPFLQASKTVAWFLFIGSILTSFSLEHNLYKSLRKSYSLDSALEKPRLS